ncbi:PREDICTED: uncharacterized protein LOC104779197 [Camelina sativa]|uniref:Uncharacterized protein LOC104779197 n=1 Tax=Camelina sativa TaxID=90675 RepID=A0ABM0YJD7_CAMSA|nr:PREDICTED: uncharacterized protein LOC104779197 [Camelina sativa]
MDAETVDSTQPLLHINMSNVSKLTSLNYVTWSLQVHSLLDGYDLAGFIDGTTPSPSPTVTTNGQTITNTDFTKWRRQDKLIYNGLLGTLSPIVQPLVSTTKSASEMWRSLADTYAKPSRGHVQQLRHELKNLPKGDKTIDEYMQGLTTRFEKLSLLGQPVLHEEQIEYILQGLPEEYKSVVDQFEGRDVSPTITLVHEKLLTKEAKLLSVSTVVPSHVPLSANVATSRPRLSQYQPNNRHNQHHNQQYNSKHDGRMSRGYQGKCKICGVFGHSACRCPQYSQPLSTPPNGLLPTPFCPWKPRANLALSSQSLANPWIMESGATHHMTNDLNNLAMNQPYMEEDSVLMLVHSPFLPLLAL